MPNSQKFEFNPALQYPIKWQVAENRFDEDGKNPRQLSLAIPIESIPGLCNYLMSLEEDTSKHKEGKVWDFENNEEVEIDVVYINAKGKSGQYGDFGNINPTMPKKELPF
tara:strand:- start:757 stop:1086 length:330 start_codon:yes stop_codon:yes gene_type:complete